VYFKNFLRSHTRLKARFTTNGTVVDDVIRFVSQKSKYSLRSSDDNDNDEVDKEKSKEPDYGEDNDNDNLEEAQKEEEAGEITTNEVFSRL
jgi:hypothetical protein